MSFGNDWGAQVTEVIVIGAGPYGLSIAANLQQYNIPFRIFGRTMSMWTDHMPKGMVLKSDGFATNLGGLPLTLERFCRNTGRAYGHLGHRTPIADVIAYAKAFQAHYIGAVEDTRVKNVASHGHGFLVRLENGEEVFSNRVVVATGLMGFERMPEIAHASDRLTHASAHNDLSHFAGKSVAVIGAGQSAFETAALLNEQGAQHVTVLNRRPAFWFDPEGESVPNVWTRLRHPNFGLGPGWRTWLWSEAPRVFHWLPRTVRVANAHSTFGPAGSGWLKHRVLGVPNIDVLVGVAQRVNGNRLWITTPDGRDRWVDADHIIAATGYRVDLRRIPFLTGLLLSKAGDINWVAQGIPALNRRYETSIPGLHIAGYLSAMSWGPSMRFIYGTNFAAPYLVRNLGYSAKTSVQVNRSLSKQTA